MAATLAVARRPVAAIASALALALAAVCGLPDPAAADGDTPGALQARFALFEISGSDASTGTVTVKWTENTGANVAAVRIRYRVGRGSWTETASISSPQFGPHTRAISGLDSRHDYEFQIRDSSSNSAYPAPTDVLSFSFPRASGAVPGAYSSRFAHFGISAEDVSTGAVTVQWEQVAAGKSANVRIRYRVSPNGRWTETSNLADSGAGRKTHSISGLDVRNVYDFQIRGVANNGQYPDQTDVLRFQFSVSAGQLPEDDEGIKSVVLTRSGSQGKTPLCESITLNLQVTFDPANLTDVLDYAIQEEDGSGNVIGIIKRVTVNSHTDDGDQQVTTSESVAHCSVGPRFYRGVAQLQQVGDKRSPLVTIEWEGSVLIEVFENTAANGGNLTLRSSMKPTAWPGISLQLQRRDLRDPEGVWTDDGAAVTSLPATKTVTSAAAAARQYRWQLTKDDIVLYSNVVLLYWSSPRATPTPMVVRGEDTVGINQVALLPGERYTTEVPEITGYETSEYTCEGRVGVLLEVSFNPAEHAEHYGIRYDGAHVELLQDDGPSGYIAFCRQGERGGGPLVVYGYIDNKGQPAYELTREDQRRIVVPADSLVFTPPAEIAVSWDTTAPDNPFTATAPEKTAEDPLEGVEDLARILANLVGASPDRMDTLLPVLCLLVASGLTAAVMVPLGWSPPALAAGGVVFVSVWTLAGPEWFGVPLAMALALPMILMLAGAMILRTRSRL